MFPVRPSPAPAGVGGNTADTARLCQHPWPGGRPPYELPGPLFPKQTVPLFPNTHHSWASNLLFKVSMNEENQPLQCDDTPECLTRACNFRESWEFLNPLLSCLRSRACGLDGLRIFTAVKFHAHTCPFLVLPFTDSVSLLTFGISSRRNNCSLQVFGALLLILLAFFTHHHLRDSLHHNVVAVAWRRPASGLRKGNETAGLGRAVTQAGRMGAGGRQHFP